MPIGIKTKRRNSRMIFGPETELRFENDVFFSGKRNFPHINF